MDPDEIVDESGAPITVGMLLSVEREPASGMLCEPFTTSTDARGAFVIANLPAGAVSISASQTRSSGDNPVEVHIGEWSLLGVRERKWRVGPEHVWLAAGADQFVRLTARRMAN